MRLYQIGIIALTISTIGQMREKERQTTTPSDPTLDVFFEIYALLLQATDAASTSFQRMGIATLPAGRSVRCVAGVLRTPMSVEQTYNSLGWKRRVLKIV
jgi:hypothetical protein